MGGGSYRILLGRVRFQQPAQWLLLEKKLIKNLVTLKQESNEVQADWAIIHRYLIDLNLNGKDKQEKTSNFEMQEN